MDSIDRETLVSKRAEYEAELGEAIRAVARLQGAITAIDDLLASLDGHSDSIEGEEQP